MAKPAGRSAGSISTAARRVRTRTQAWPSQLMSTRSRLERNGRAGRGVIEPRPSTESFELCDGIVIDLDADRRVVGIEVERASRKLDVEGLRAAIEGAPRPA